MKLYFILMTSIQYFNTTFIWIKGVMFLTVNLLIVFFAPIALVATIVGLATLVDMGFAIWMTRKLKGKVTSVRAREGLVKKTFAYIALILAVYVVDEVLIGHLLKLFIEVENIATKTVAVVLIGIEVYSIDESYKAVKGKSFLDKMFKTVRKMYKAKKEIENKDL